MDYEAAVAAAPPGWRHFTVSDLDRLRPSIRSHELARVPADDRRLLEAGDPRAGERVLKATFWTLVYNLEPERWDSLARAEPIAPGLLNALPPAERALDVGAGSGRLTAHLARTCGTVVAVDPAIGLLRLLRSRMRSVHTIAAWAEALPIADGWSTLTAASGAFGPDPDVLRELFRVTSPRGVIALINPEQPEWFEDQGWQRVRAEPAPAPAHDRALDAFFGPPDPPADLVLTRKRS